ncbi:MAG: OmpA family protein [Bacteroidales bacterium]|nr:OmpA family protein [Bacteroidales bacterium]
MKKLIIFTVVFLYAEICFSQTDNFKELKDWQLKGYAQSAELYNDDITAIKYYSEYYNRKKDDFDIAYKLADLYFSVKDYKKAKPLYYIVYKKDKFKYPKSIFKYGQTLKAEENFDSAAVCFQIYIDEFIYRLKKNEQNQELFLVEKELKGCEDADFLSESDSEKITIQKLNQSINTSYKEASPVIWNDTTLIYTSYMIDSVPVININTRNLPNEKYYSAKLTGNYWQGGFPAPKPFINLKKLSMSGGAFSDDRQRFYFAAGKKDIYGRIHSSIYVSTFKNGKWSKPEKLNEKINLKKYISTQPAVGKCYNPDLDVIYFVSDRPGGYGKTDIWYTVYDKTTREYKTPVNAGSYINTPGNEITSNINNDTKALYFSSDGHSGYGGYDIYKTFGELVNWIPPKNMGKPVNSSFDDIWFTQFKNNSAGFIVSNRDSNINTQTGHCCYDIFKYGVINKKIIEISDTIFETDKQIYNELAKNKKAKNKIKKISANTIVKLHIKNNDNGKYICLATDTTDNNGKFHFKIDKNQNYKLTIEKENYTPMSLILNSDNLIHNKSDLKSLTIIPVQKNPVTLHNIYFEFNKWDLTEKSKLYLDTFLYKVMEKNKDIVIEVSAHTDGIGDSGYNLALSEKRAESVVKYLMQKGINKNRLIAKGYGEESPIVPEVLKNGEDNPKARAKNRRIEFRVISVLINQ